MGGGGACRVLYAPSGWAGGGEGRLPRHPNTHPVGGPAALLLPPPPLPLGIPARPVRSAHVPAQQVGAIGAASDALPR
jgi:hypothetical protein